MIYRIMMGITALFFLIGCGGQVKQLQMRDTSLKATEPSQGMKTVEFPKGTWTGGSSTKQAGSLAELFVNSHNMAMSEFSKLQDSQDSIKTAQEALKNSTQRLEESNRLILEAAQKQQEAAQKHHEVAQKTLEKIEEVSREQGTGQITLFYPVGSSKLQGNSLEYERLVRFVDFLSRESKGRKILFVSLGSASAFGPPKVNLKLAKARADFPKTIIDKYLVNTPHEYYKVYGTGDLYSPKKVSKREHERYQHTRLIALYDSDKAPSLPEEPSKN
jgi:outer membrane protein OmpA-like peptidoglycan-associated protein